VASPSGLSPNKRFPQAENASRKRWALAL